MYRTQDFRDSNRNGVDDRDEKNQGGNKYENSQYQGQSRMDPGYYNYKNMMDQFFSWQPGPDDDEGRAYKYSFMGDLMSKGFDANLAMGMGDFQSGISKDLMGYQSMLSQQEQSNARFEEFNYGMDSMREQERLQSKFANDQFGRDIGMLGATGEQTRKNYAAMGVQNRLGQITAGEQTRLNYAAQGDQTRKNYRVYGDETRKTDTNRIRTTGDETRKTMTHQFEQDNYEHDRDKRNQMSTARGF